MVIDKRTQRLLGSGVYADVFEIDGRVYKLFKRFPQIPPRQTESGRRRVFECQVRAFQLASVDPWLKDHVATFHGCCVIEDVLDLEGKSVEKDYLLDCCYMVERLAGEEAKLTTPGLREKHGYLSDAAERFKSIGVAVADSSVFNAEDPERFKFIDIELRDC